MIVTLHEPDEVATAEAIVREQLARAGLPLEWARVGMLLEDQYLKIDRCAVRFNSGALGTYLRVAPGRPFAGGVAIVARHADNLLMVRQFRFASQQEHLEIPRGFLGRDEDVVGAGLRELGEETGATAATANHIGAVWPDNGLLAWRVHVVVANISGNVSGPRSSDEITSVEAVPVSAIDNLIADGRLSDAISIAALTLARAKRAL